MPAPGPLAKIRQIVVLMLENRSFDSMLGFLYADRGNRSPSGQPFEGLTGNETNPDATGKPVPVFRIQPTTPNAWFMPGADPGEGFVNTNLQLFGKKTAPVAPTATNQGFVTNFNDTIQWQKSQQGWYIVPGTTPANVMGIFTPATLPVLSALARGFAVCDQWYSSVPTETLPNRAFAFMATSQGQLNDQNKVFTAPSIFSRLTKKGVTWKIYGYDEEPLSEKTCTDIAPSSTAANFGLFKDFQADAAAGKLPGFSFLEPDWGKQGNSQHPNYGVAAGEQLILDTYRAVRGGKQWSSTLLVITYDEHGGCYDHVLPPGGATPPDDSPSTFDFKRFGVRVPAVLVSPWIDAGTVFRVPAGATPIDHTSILKTLEKRWGLAPLTARDAAAPDLGAVLTRAAARTDDPLKGVTAPVPPAAKLHDDALSHLQQVHAALTAQLPTPVPAPVPVRRGASSKGPTGTSAPKRAAVPKLKSAAEYKAWVNERTRAWRATRSAGRGPTKRARKATT